VPAIDTSRLLDAFTRVLSFLQTPSVTADTGTGTPAGGIASAADKLKQFISTLAQSLHAGGRASPLSPLGSRLNLTA
jgi:hypothetical protein